MNITAKELYGKPARDYRSLYEAAKVILEIREHELIQALGHCDNSKCNLHRRHVGQCNTPITIQEGQ